ncbi:hypothetical protein MP228_004056 [Amoeboaphelidium protococcarum]|nr:hypothetical protein MP228_004056 [Amoeboaphelidium protococcarum]
MPGASLIFRQLFCSESSTFTYILGCVRTRESVIIDPVVEHVERDLQFVKELNLSLKYAMNTHCHADHITGTGAIKQRLQQVKSVISRASQAQADLHLDDGDSVQFGDHILKAISTPGHTDGCMCFYLQSQGLLFTGDTLLIRGCGRTDFQQGNAGDLYDNVHKKLMSLPEDTLVYPAHDYKGRTCSSIREERQFNPRFTLSRDDFIKFMANLNLPYPKKIDIALPANLRCGL